MSNLTRREFGAGLFGAMATLPLFDKLKPSVFGGVQIGVQSYTFRTFTIDKMIQKVRNV